MMIYLWADGQREGPMLLETIHSRLKHGSVPAGSLFSIGEGEGDWKPLSELPPLPPLPVSIETPTPRVDKWVMQVDRRSDWANALRILGVVAFVGAFIYGASTGGISRLWEGVVAAIALFFVAFLVDLATDIRWQLNAIRERLERQQD